MKELKFIRVLSKLPKSDIAKFDLYLKSPYFTKNESYKALFDFAVKKDFHPHITSDERKQLWNRIFPGQLYEDTKWRKICNELIDHLNNFFIHEQINKKVLLGFSLQLEYIKKNNLDILTNSTISSIDKVFSTKRYISTENHLYSFLYNSNKYDLLDFEINIEEESNIELVHFHLDLFYLAEKIKQLVNVLTRKNDLNIPINVALETEILEIINKDPFKQYPEIYIYSLIYRIKKGNESIDIYKQLKKSVLESLSNFELTDAIDILKETINYCSLQLNKGKPEYAQETLAWYKFGLKHGLIFSASSSFNPGTFLNIVMSGIRTKEFAWTENFIEEYQKIIPKESKKDIVTFSLARLYFNQNKLADVIEKLRDVEFNELTYNLDAKVLLLATYYEADEITAMISLADSYRTYLNRHEKDITKAKQLRYLNFIKFIKKLSRVKYQDKKSKENLIEDIQNTDGVVNKVWLIEKAKGL